jgi:hypothetical protein
MPDAPLVIVTKESLLAAVQSQLAPANTLTRAVPPAAGIDTVVGETENVHGASETVMCSLPVAFSYVALMSVSPAATALTIPRSTVAIAVFDDCHVASEVTGRLEPSRSAAVAVNCATAPTEGVVPLTVTAATEEGELGGDPPHATESDAIVANSRKDWRTYYVSTDRRRRCR